MDTICFFRVYHQWEDPKPYIALKEIPAPDGCTAWILSLKNTESHICWIKIQCHEQIGYGIATAQDIAHLRSVVDGWLAHAGLLLDDFTLGRIDYDYNFDMDSSEFDVLMETMQQLSRRIMRMDKWGWEYEIDEADTANKKKSADKPTVYYLCKSRHAQLYRKAAERKAKGRLVRLEETDMCRQEVQCHSGRIKYMRREYGLARNWETWVTPEMESEYLTTAEPIFQAGDFYKLDDAIDIIQASDFSNCHKKRLEEMLVFIQCNTMNKLKEFASRNTNKKYLSMLKDLNVNPLTIKPNKDGITYIKNPFFKCKGI